MLPQYTALLSLTHTHLADDDVAVVRSADAEVGVGAQAIAEMGVR